MIRYSYLLILIIILLSSCKSRLIFRDDFSSTDLTDNWEILNDSWELQEGILQGQGVQDKWSVILCRKELPENYVIEFSTLLNSENRLLELILNLHDEKFVGVLMGYQGKTIQLEDRTLLMKDGKADIRTKDNIGQLPEVSYQKKTDWSHWKVQKAGNRLFVWIDGKEIIFLYEWINILKSGGRFGFATSGDVLIKNIQVVRSNKKAPEDFKGLLDVRNLFLFGEK